MVRSTDMAHEPDALRSPPLFVTAHTADGKRHEGLLEFGRPLPDWLGGRMSMRVAAPSGAFADIDVKPGSFEAGYASCLERLGAERVWSPASERVLEALPDLEVWAPEDTDVEIHDEGPVLAIEADAAPGPIRFYAVVRNGEGPTAHVANGGKIYLDVDEGRMGNGFVPRALLDTGLAGAFWGFNDHGNAAASLLVARRLLDSIFGDGSQPGPRDATSIAAAAHAVLIHRVLLPEYGPPVMAAVGSFGEHLEDAVLLTALLGMAQLSIGEGDKAKVVGDVSTAMRVTASHRPAFGETLRILNAQFSILSDIARSAVDGPAIDEEIAAVDAMLHACYVGGQAATYLGDPAIEAGDLWHDVVAKKKSRTRLSRRPLRIA